MSIGIYKITSPAGRIYIGQSINIEKRFIGYKYSHTKRQPLLKRSFDKYGLDNHKFEIVCLCKIDLLNKMECYFIDYYKSFNSTSGLNLRHGGDSWICSDETRLKMSIAKKNRIVSDKTRKKLSEVNTGKSRPGWVKQKISNTQKSIKRTDAHNKSLSESLKKSLIVQEKMRKMQQKCMKRVFNTETNVYYASATDAAKIEGFKKSSLINMLNGFRKNKTALVYVATT